MPRITAKEIIKVLEKKGFFFSRQSGSHKIYKNDQKKRAIVPFHPNKILHPKTLKRIMEQADISFEELIEVL